MAGKLETLSQLRNQRNENGKANRGRDVAPVRQAVVQAEGRDRLGPDAAGQGAAEAASSAGTGPQKNMGKAAAVWREVTQHAVQVAGTQGYTVSEADARVALDVQFLWAREQMRTGSFHAVRVPYLGTFRPMPKSLMKAVARERSGQVAAETEPADPDEVASVAAVMARMLEQLEAQRQAAGLDPNGRPVEPAPLAETSQVQALRRELVSNGLADTLSATERKLLGLPEAGA